MNTIAPHDTYSLVNQPTTLFIDVREPAEHATAHIEGSTLAALSKLDKFMIADGISDVVVYCQKGIRAEKAIKQLQIRYAHLRFHNLKGGINGWQEAGLHVVKGQPKGLTLDRQVQLTVGAGVLISTLLAATVSMQWLWFTGLLGVGLFVTGATGTCGLALLMARMPWNQ
ncbi:DUF2892 domain-containing protein [Alteromonas sediminis]|uniref:DUF2892 domain-containing protein n=1 Tax=Alteromonas sediminis TaxID=2259342 RepID=A0A3N5Y2L7_9ALTE|nr:rhodanese-like domain-containing protein [Alteromonas sediminis]RPJ67992.1 DUF2892 domain-containing protein [Alteromonas sediminis]